MPLPDVMMGLGGSARRSQRAYGGSGLSVEERAIKRIEIEWLEHALDRVGAVRAPGVAVATELARFEATRATAASCSRQGRDSTSRTAIRA